MTKTLLALSLLLVLCGLTRSVPALPPFDSSNSNTAAQDVTGTVWTTVPSGEGDGKIRCRQNSRWIDNDIPGAEGFQLLVVERGEDGGVYALWQKSSQASECLVTVHRGAMSHVLTRFSGSVIQGQFGFLSPPSLFAGAGGDVWIAGRQPLLRHLLPDGTLQTFPLKPEQFFSERLPDDFNPPAYASQVDGMGRRWFWEDGAHSRCKPGSLRGVLIWDGKTLAYHATLAGVPDQPITACAVQDANHLLLATAADPSQGPRTGCALSQVDIHTLTALPEAFPKNHTYQDILQLFRANDDWYAVSGRMYSEPSVLWRKRAGHWRRCLESIETKGGYFGQIIRYPWLSEPSGTWLGVNGGAWWLPANGKPPVWVDWRSGLPAFNFAGLFPEAGGGILAVSTDHDAARMPSTPQPVLSLPLGVVTGGMSAPAGIGPLYSDPRQHLWGVHFTPTRTQSLDEWDGLRWRQHLHPKNMPDVTGLYACDTLGRLWLTTSEWHPPAEPQPVEGEVIYDPVHDSWTNYARVPDALQAAAALPGMGFRLSSHLSQPPLFSGDGRVLYVDNNTTIFLYTGKRWRHWEARDILPAFQYGSLPDPPHFNPSGALEVALNACCWDWTPAAGWQQAGVYKDSPYHDPVPLGGPLGLCGTPAVDDNGNEWIVWQNAVYIAGDGLWVKPPELSAPGSPFRFGYRIFDVLYDPTGRLFLDSGPGGYSDLVVWSPPPVLRPTAAVTPTSDDSVAVHFKSALRGPHWFLWRLNGGAWSAPMTDTSLRLTALARGDYRVEVQALDSRLQRSASSAAVFSIRVAPDVQIAHWIAALLHGTEDEREAAAAGLVKQPDAALPALQAARPTAADDARWWIDAAIQQIEDQKQPAD